MKSMTTNTQKVKRKKEKRERQRQQKLNNSVKKKVENVKTNLMATIPENGNALLMTPAMPNTAPSTDNGLTLHGETKSVDGLPEWANDTDSDISEMSTASGLSEGSGIPNSPSSASSASSASSPASSMSTPSAAFTSPRVSFGTPSSTPPSYPEEPAKEEKVRPEIQISGFIFRYRDHSVRMALNKVK